MIEEIRMLTGGMYKDASPINQPENTYKQALNFVQLSKDGDIYAITNERGTIQTATEFPEGFKVMGYHVIDSDIIVALVNGDYSQIGKINTLGQYKRICPSIEVDDSIANTNGELGFSLDRPVDIEAKKKLAGTISMYFCDGTDGRPMGFLDESDVPEIGDIADNTKVIPNQKLPIIDIQEIRESGGNLSPGAYFFVTRYLTADLTETIYGEVSNAVYIPKGQSSNGRDAVDGDYQDYGSTGKSIVLTISNVDTSFPYIQVVAIKYEGESDTFSAEALPEIGVDGSSVNFVYSGGEDDVIPITQEELAAIPVSYSAAKSVTQKDNVLMWSNLADNSQRFDEELQKFFNNIEVGYEIEEIPYLGSTSETLDGTFDLDGNPYTQEGDDTKVVIETTKDIDFDDSNSTSNYTLSDGGTAASTSVSFVNTVTVGSTIVVSKGISFVTYTAKDGAVDEGERAFDVSSGDSEIIANSFADTVQYFGDNEGTDVFPSVTGSSVTLYAGSAGTYGNAYSATVAGTGISGGGSFTGGVNNTTSNPTSVSTGTSDSQIVLTFSSSVTSYATLAFTIYSEDSRDAYNFDTPVSQVDESNNTFQANLGAFNDYKDPRVCYYGKTYKRGETYSLGAVVTFNDSSKSFNYHIPGNVKNVSANSDLTAKRIEASDNLLGTYINGVTKYPANQFYPGTTEGSSTEEGDDLVCWDGKAQAYVNVADRAVRHHYMPTLEQEPHFRRDSEGNVFIRVIKLKFTYKETMSIDLRDAIQAITFTREKRDTTENKSVFAQGLVSRYYCGGSRWSSGGSPEDYRWRKVPFFNSSDLRPSGITWHIYFDDGDDQDNSTVYYPSNNRMAFFSPDSQLIGDFNFTNIIGAKVKPVLNLQMTNHDSYFKKQTTQGGDRMKKFTLLWMYANWDSNKTTNSDNSAIIEDAFFVAKGSEISLSDARYKLDNGQSSRHLYIKVGDGLDYGVKGTVYQDFADNSEWSSWRFQPDPNNQEMEQNLMDIVSDNSDQYGSPSGSDYIPIHKTYTIPVSIGNSESNIYGGDIFISKFAYRNNDVVPYAGKFRSNAASATSYSSAVATQHDGTDSAPGMNLKTISYFFVESQVNCNYRHRFHDLTEDADPEFEVDYFPHEEIDPNGDGNWQDGVFAPRGAEGDTRGYNLQYSYENDVIRYSNKLAAQTTIGKFPNRTIYSEKSKEDELSDSYRIYKQNSFYDLPQTTGEIWNSFVYNNALYLHTPKSLWRAFVNDTTHQATTVGDVVLGTGGLFTLPAKEMMVTTGGYAGTISQWAGCLTPYGYFFPDVLQGKIFLLQGDQLREVSQKGMRQTFIDNMDDLISGFDYLDNPFTGSGMTLGFDFELGRLLVTKVSSDPFTYSYTAMNDAWISEHSYIPNGYITQNKSMYSIINNNTVEMYEHNKGDYCTFYGTKYDAVLELTFQKSAGIDKTWDNMKLHTVSKNNEVVQQLDCFNSMRVNSDTRNTGPYDMVVTNQYGSQAVSDGEVRVRRVNNKFNLTIPRDAVIDSTQNIFDSSNLDNTMLYAPRIKGDYITAEFIYNNVDNYQFIVNFISASFRPNRA